MALNRVLLIIKPDPIPKITVVLSVAKLAVPMAFPQLQLPFPTASVVWIIERV
jgi:hypothetical protein